MGADSYVPFTIAVGADSGRVVLALSGELDAYTVQELEPCLAMTIQNDSCDVVFDLGELVFMDSTGIALIARTHQQLASRGRRLELRHVVRQPRSVLEITGFDALIAAEPTFG
jgi:anti-anti-sigma factor